jgi:hypothetical protein
MHCGTDANLWPERGDWPGAQQLCRHPVRTAGFAEVFAIQDPNGRARPDPELIFCSVYRRASWFAHLFRT